MRNIPWKNYLVSSSSFPLVTWTPWSAPELTMWFANHPWINFWNETDSKQWRNYFIGSEQSNNNNIHFVGSEKLFSPLDGTFSDKNDWVEIKTSDKQFQWMDLFARIDNRIEEIYWSEDWSVSVSRNERGVRLHEEFENRAAAAVGGESNSKVYNNEFLGNPNPIRLMQAEPINCKFPNVKNGKSETYLTQKSYDWLNPKFKAILAVFTLKKGCGMNKEEEEKDLLREGIEEEDSISLEKVDFISERISQETGQHDGFDNGSVCSVVSEKSDDTLSPLPIVRNSISNSKTFSDAYEVTQLRRTSPGGSSIIMSSPIKPIVPLFDLSSSISRPFSSFEASAPMSEDETTTSESDSISLLNLPLRQDSAIGRRGSEPCLPKLRPPRVMKTPPGFNLRESKFWALRNPETFALVDSEKRMAGSSTKKLRLKEIPSNRSRSAVEVKSPRSFYEPLLSSGPTARMSSTHFSFFMKPKEESQIVTMNASPEGESSILKKMQQKLTMSVDFKKKRNARSLRRNYAIPFARSIIKVGPTKIKKFEQENNNNNDQEQQTVKIINYKAFLAQSTTDESNKSTRDNPRHARQQRRQQSAWMRFLRKWNLRKFLRRRKAFKS